MPTPTPLPDRLASLTLEQLRVEHRRAVMRAAFADIDSAHEAFAEAEEFTREVHRRMEVRS
jgi:hypothetical protein